MSEEEKKAIEDLKNAVNEPLEVFENVVDTFKPVNLEQCRIILNLIEKQQRKLKEVEDYVTSHDFFNLLCTPYTPGKRKPYFIAHDKLLTILEGDDKDV